MIDWEGIEAAGIAAAMGAMDRGAQRVAVRAKQLAPYRRVSEGGLRTRLKTRQEILVDQPERARLSLAPDVRGASRIVTSRQPPQTAAISRRGRYELRTGRAEGQHLRDQIHAEPARREGSIITSRVVSPARHSKFQEYGTRDTPAHPYMRPAAHEEREALRADVASSVAAAIQSRMSGRIEATIKMKAR